MDSISPSQPPNPYHSEESLHQILRKSVAAGASDVHLKVGQRPAARVHGNLVYFRLERLGAESTEVIARQLLGSRKDSIAPSLECLREYDCSYDLAGCARFRVHIYRQRSSLAISLRVIPHEIPKLSLLNTPPAWLQLAQKDRGLVLCVGAAGQGKTTTLAAIVDHMNHSMARHVVTIEDPIEYLHTDDRCSISQREIGVDTASYADALRAAMRQNADVIVVGEIRDPESMEFALKAAETGHLVLSTLHTPDVQRTVNRVIALSKGPSEDVRERFGDVLQGIFAQRLLPRADGSALALASEVLVGTGSVRESIKRPQGNPPLKELMEQGADLYGMQTFEMAVCELVRVAVVSEETARPYLAF
ncbi:MAG TPA: PilT/PilU family type 4a pilus ATPase [Polyangiaceae bacterium]|nr:PilT/PilU family type 4a pilus ATPase [Polyangiaceae bacterium]